MGHRACFWSPSNGNLMYVLQSLSSNPVKTFKNYRHWGNRWFSRCVIAAMLMDENKGLSLASFIRPPVIVALLSVSLEVVANHLFAAVKQDFSSEEAGTNS